MVCQAHSEKTSSKYSVSCRFILIKNRTFSFHTGRDNVVNNNKKMEFEMRAIKLYNLLLSSK